MAGKFPFLKVYLSDLEGNHDFRNKNRTVTLWMSDKVDDNGNNILNGGIDGDPKDSKRWALGYKCVQKPRDGGEGGRNIPTAVPGHTQNTEPEPEPEPEDDFPF